MITRSYAARLPHVLAIACLFLSGAARAETLTLDRAVELALERNLSLKVAYEEYDAAKWGLRSARASLFPSVRLSSTARRVDPDTYDRANASLAIAEQFGVEVEPFLYRTTYETGFNLTVPLFNGGKLWGGVGLAAAARDAASHSYESRQRGVAVETKSAYFSVLRAEALVSVARDAVAAATANVDAAGRKVDVGLISRAELLRWEVVRANDRVALAEAENAVSISRTNLANVLGLPLDSSVELVEVDRSRLDSLFEEFSWLLEVDSVSEADARQLLAGNPDYASLADATRISRSGVTIARGAFLPSLNASGSYGWKADDDVEPDDESAWSVTLALDLPVFTSFKNLSDYQESKRTYLAAERRQEDYERAMIAGLRNTLASVRSSMKALNAADTQVAQAGEHLKNVTSRYDQGMAPYIEFVDAQVTYDRSRAGYVNALYSSFLAFAEAERILGKDPENVWAQ